MVESRRRGGGEGRQCGQRGRRGGGRKRAKREAAGRREIVKQETEGERLCRVRATGGVFAKNVSWRGGVLYFPLNFNTRDYMNVVPIRFGMLH